jgi:hypothetical protein
MKLREIIFNKEENKILLNLIYDMLIGEEFNLKPTEELMIEETKVGFRIKEKTKNYFEIIFPTTEIEMWVYCGVSNSNIFYFDIFLSQDINFSFNKRTNELTKEQIASELKAFLYSVEERLDKYFINS